MVALEGDAGQADGVVINGRRWVRCSQAQRTDCNWLTAADVGGIDHTRCLADSLIRCEPVADDQDVRRKLVPAVRSLRRLTWQLDDIGLPITPYWEAAGGLAFELRSSADRGEKVVIGHANGVITIDLDESLDAYREQLREDLNEPYRTMLGHFRHEAGHYYQGVLVERDPGAHAYLADCRAIFGDERADYAEALERHYESGPPALWRTDYISEYATMHPWEDFAECFAHYLHITDTIDTCREAGMVLAREKVRFDGPTGDIAPLENYDDVPVARMLDDWKWMSLFFNRVNTSMGKGPLYPFDLPDPVVTKLGFIHRVVRDTARTTVGQQQDRRATARRMVPNGQSGGA